MQKKFKSIKEVAEELRNKGELDEGKYERLQEKIASKRVPQIALVAVLLFGFIFGMVHSNSNNEKIGFAIFVTVLSVLAFFEIRKTYINNINLYNFGTLVSGVISDVKYFSIGYYGGYNIHYEYLYQEQVLSNQQRVSISLLPSKPQKGDKITVVCDLDNTNDSIILFDQDYLIKNIKKVT